jgi:hypothetical protein
VGLLAGKEIADPSKVAPPRKPARSCAAVAVSRSAHTASPWKEFADRGITLDVASAVPSSKLSNVEEDTDGFNTVAYRKKTTIGAPAVIILKHRRQPPIGVRNSASLPIISRKKRLQALFVTRLILKSLLTMLRSL